MVRGKVVCVVFLVTVILVFRCRLFGCFFGVGVSVLIFFGLGFEFIKDGICCE